MARTVHQILGLLGAKDPAAISVYPLAATPPVRAAWTGVWGADFGRLTAAISSVEKSALIAAGASERPAR